ncbi:hypothetical protein RCL1_001147 [Eukaryota sp. TZLM3-RCL]
MVSSLPEVFFNSLSDVAPIRTAAEDVLSQWSQSPGFYKSCIELIVSDSLSQQIRLAAAIYIKNHTLKYWSIADKFHESDRDFIKKNIIPSVVSISDETLRDMLALVISHVAIADYPSTWPDMETQLFSFLSTQIDTFLASSSLSPSLISSLVAFRKAICLFEFTSLPKRKFLTPLLAKLMPLLLKLVHFALPLYCERDRDEQICEIFKWIFETIHSANRLGLNSYFCDLSVFFHWSCPMSALLRIGCKNIENSENLIKTHKSILKFLVANMERYSVTSSTTSEMAPFSTFLKSVVLTGNLASHGNLSNLIDPFSHQLFGKGIINSVLTYLENHLQFITTNTLPEKNTSLSLALLNRCVSFKDTWALISPVFEHLYRSVLFTLMCFRNSDFELYQEDPQEFVRRSVNHYDQHLSPTANASNLILNSIKKRAKTSLPVIGGHVLSVLNNFDSDKTQLDGVLNVIALLSTRLESGKISLPPPITVSAIITTNVLPLLSQNFSENLVYRALSVIKSFKPTIQNFGSAENIANIVFSLGSFLSSPSLPLKMEATLALRNFLLVEDPKSEEVISEVIRKFLQEFLNSLFLILDEIGLVDITETINIVISRFSTECLSMTTAIVDRLIASFESVLRHHDVTLSDLDKSTTTTESLETKINDDIESGLLGILRTLITLFECFDNQEELFVAVSDRLTHLLLILLKGHLFELFEPSLSLATHITASAPVPFSPIVWQLWPAIISAFDSFAVDYLPYMSLALDNMMARDPSSFALRPDALPSLMVLVNKCFATDDVIVGPSEKNPALKVVQSAFVNLENTNFRNVLSSQLPFFVNLFIDELLIIAPVKKLVLLKRSGCGGSDLFSSQSYLDSPSLETNLLVTFATFINFDPLQTISLLSSMGTTNDRIQRTVDLLGSMSEVEYKFAASCIPEDVKKNSSVVYYVLESLCISSEAFSTQFSRTIVTMALIALIRRANELQMTSLLPLFAKAIFELVGHFKTKANEVQQSAQDAMGDAYKDFLLEEDLEVGDCEEEDDQDAATISAIARQASILAREYGEDGFDEEDDLRALEDVDIVELVKSLLNEIQSVDENLFTNICNAGGGLDAVSRLLS